MRLLVIDNAEPADRYYNEPLVTEVSRWAETEVINHRELPADHVAFMQYGAVIFSGVPLHYSFDTIGEDQSHLEWIRSTDIPVLGICLGHQNIGKLFGSVVMPNEEQGMKTMQVMQADPIFNTMLERFEARASHRASVSVPNAFSLLASSATCPNQIMRHTEKMIYGVQFHPEHCAVGKVLLQNFITLAAEYRPLVQKQTGPTAMLPV